MPIAQQTAMDHGRNHLFGPPASLVGVIPYRGELAQQGYRLNSFLVDISHYQNRQNFLDDENMAMERAGLSAEEREMIARRDYNAMLAYGVNIYAIAKAGYVFGNTLLEIGNSMRQPSPQKEIE